MCLFSLRKLFCDLYIYEIHCPIIDGATHSIFSNTPQCLRQLYGDKYQACNSRVLQLSNSAEILPRVASEKEQEAASKNTLF